MIQPDQIPQYTGNLEQLEKAHADLKKDAGHVRGTGSDVHTQFQGLSAYYQAPEAEQLFATTKPVQARADTFADNLEIVSSALSDYATEIRPLAAKLKQLKIDAAAFVDSVKDDDEWEYDGDKVDEHNQLRDDITTTVAAFWAAERTCHNKIVLLWCGRPVVAGDGSKRKDQYGFDADDMKNAKLPWGDPVDERHHWYEVGHWVKSFVWDGIVVDGIWTTIKGLGTLVGFGGWDAMGQAWKGLAQLGTGLALSSIPGVGNAFWTLPDDKLPSWIRDSRKAMKETGKALVAWDEWGKNPARAAGAVTFNVLTTVFTGGSGAAASGAGKAGAVAKALSMAGKAGRAIDPMTYMMKGAGAGLSKIGDIGKALKGVGKIEIPRLPDDAFILPEGTVKLPDGTVHLPEGAAVPDGAVKLPDGNVKLPDDVTVLPEGTTKLPSVDGSPAQYMDPRGNLLDHEGNVVQHADRAPTDIVDKPDAGVSAAGPDVPHTPSPVREPALVGAGTHGAGQVGEHIQLGDSLADGLGDVGRVGEDVPTTPAVHAGGDLPGSRLGDHIPSGRGDAPMPTNSVDAHVPAGTADNAVSGAPGHDRLPGGHADDVTTPGHDLPGDGGPTSPPAHGAGGGGLDGLGGFGDDALDQVDSTGDAAQGAPGHADEAAKHRAEYEAAREKPADERTPAERAAITREHVRLANDDPAWRAEHYDKWGPGKRNNAEELVDGQLLPKLVEKPGGGWMSAHDLPYANPEKYHLEDLVRGRDTVDLRGLEHLDDVAAKRKAGMDLTNTRNAFDDNPTTETAQALDKAQKHFDATVGEGVSNNSKLGEALGEEAARRHMLRLKEFEGAHEIKDLPGTPNGSKRFDQLWRDGDGNLVIVEAKGPAGSLDWRRGNGVPDERTMVKQGTVEYVRTICSDMEDRVLVSPKDGEYAAEIRAAIDDKSLRYVLVQATENTGRYEGAELRYFKIS